MINLYEILANAQGGEAMTSLARQFKLTEQQTQAAVDALLPAFSLGLKQMSATPAGMASLFGMMAQPNYQAMFEGAQAFDQGRNSGNDALGMMFGSPEMSRAVAEQAAQYAGIGSGIMKKMLPVIAAMIIGGMMRSMSQGGMGDVFGQILGQMTGNTPNDARQAPQMPQMPGGDILGGMLGSMFGNPQQPPASTRTPGLEGLSDITKSFEQASRSGTELFGQLMDTGREVQQTHLDGMQRVFEAFFKDEKER